MYSNSLSFIVIKIPAILLALTVHELSHAYVAKYLGDQTAQREGRLTMNPLAHLDPLGALMLMFGPFGWAKPVPVNPGFFQNPKKGMAFVAFAGPLSNIMLAGLAGLAIRFGFTQANQGLMVFVSFFFMINIGLAVFNLLPVYPLDGSRILMAFLNDIQTSNYMKAMTVVPMVFLFLIVAEWMFNIPILSYLLNPIFQPAFSLARKVFIGI